MAIGYDGSIRIDTKVDTKGFNTGVASIKTGLAGLKVSLAGVGTAMAAAFAPMLIFTSIAAAITGLVRMGKAGIDTASNLAEVQNVVDVAFGDMSNQVEDFANTAIEKFGLSELAAKKTAGVYQSMSKGMGIIGQEATDMSLAVTGATGDLSSYYNVTQDVADTALKSIWTGETESLKQFGVVMTQANLQQYAYSEGAKKLVTNMSQAELVGLRYRFVMETLSDVQGDFSRTYNSWANQTRLLSQRWKEFLGVIGNGLIQVLTPVLRFLNMLVSALITVASVMNQVVSGLFGKQAEQQNKVAKTATSAAKSETGLAKATEAAGKAAKGALAGFDDLNVLTQSTAENADILAEGLGADIDIPVIGGGGELFSGISISPKIQEFVDRLREKLKVLTPAVDALKEAWGRLKRAFEDLINTPAVKEVITLLVDTAKEFGKRILESALLGIAAALDILSGAFNIVAGVLKIVVGLLTGDFDMAVNGGKMVVEGFKKILEGLGKIIEAVFVLLLGKDAVEAIKTFISETATRIRNWFINDVKPWFTKEKWTELWDSVKEAFVSGWDAVKTWWTEALPKWWDENVRPWFTKEKWVEVMAGVKEGFKETFKNAVNAAIGLFNQFIGWINEKMKFSWEGLTIKGKEIFPSGSVQLFTVPSIPMLATGAVIPPNSQFMAILGDQKSGRNIEAPENLIRQIVREEGGQGGDVRVIVETNDAMSNEFAKFLKFTVQKENNRIGKTLIQGAN